MPTMIYLCAAVSLPRTRMSTRERGSYRASPGRLDEAQEYSMLLVTSALRRGADQSPSRQSRLESESLDSEQQHSGYRRGNQTPRVRTMRRSSRARTQAASVSERWKDSREQIARGTARDRSRERRARARREIEREEDDERARAVRSLRAIRDSRGARARERSMRARRTVVPKKHAKSREREQDGQRAGKPRTRVDREPWTRRQDARRVQKRRARPWDRGRVTGCAHHARDAETRRSVRHASRTHLARRHWAGSAMGGMRCARWEAPGGARTVRRSWDWDCDIGVAAAAASRPVED
ncbi:hypothetical protein BC628DRAFT_512396 [Trametes gibbosa]|nr:hypothetical protein BC628DRAFT_512396 [Trametes gibbosa]